MSGHPQRDAAGRGQQRRVHNGNEWSTFITRDTQERKGGCVGGARISVPYPLLCCFKQVCCLQSLTDQLLRIKAWDSDLEEETTVGATEIGGKNGRDDEVDKQGHLQKVQKLIYAAKVFLSSCSIISSLNLLDFSLLRTLVEDKGSF